MIVFIGSLHWCCRSAFWTVTFICFLNNVHLQRHHRLRRVAGAGNHTLTYAGRDLQETYLKVLLGNSGRSSSTTNTSTSVTDSLLSSLVLNLSSSEAEDTSKSSAPAVTENSWFKRSLPSKNWKIRYNPIPFLPLITISLLSLLLHVMWLFFQCLVKFFSLLWMKMCIA